MNKKFTAVLIVLLLILSISGCGKKSKTLPSNGIPQTKVVHIDSQPQGATVFIDNSKPVITPADVKLTLGRHPTKFRNYIELYKACDMIP